jgi:putative RNA 2'-phosphotransferase
MTHPALIERITRSLAYMLRHQPEKFDLELDAQGWGELEEVVRALNEKLGEPVEEQDVRDAIVSGDRPRYEIQGSRVRALYGHSIEVEPGEPSKPPEFLYVGVGGPDVERARKFGLRGGRRRFLHLARTAEEAREAGRRTGRDYAVLTVFALDAWEEGVNFFDRQALFLAEEVPTQFIEIEGEYDDGYDTPARPERGARPPRRGEERRDSRERGPRDARGGRGGDRPRRDDRPRGGDRPHGDDRFRGGDRPRRGPEGEPARGPREERAPSADRPPRGDRPMRDDRPTREERPLREERAPQGDRGPRDDRPPRREERREPTPALRDTAAPARTSSSTDFGLGVFESEAKPQPPRRESAPPPAPPAPPKPPPPPARPEPSRTDDSDGFGAGL